MEPLARPAPTALHDVDVPVLTHRTAELLRDHVPLTLLLDLAEAEGPRSELRYIDEGGDASWLSG